MTVQMHTYQPGLDFAPAVPVGLVRPRGTRNHNSWDPAKLDLFREAIQAGGFTSVLLLRRVADGYEVVDGHHRLAAAVAAGLHAVPALVYAAGACPDEQALAKHVGHNVYRGTIDLAEVARQVEAVGGLAGREVVAGYKPDGLAQLVGALRVPDVDLDSVLGDAFGHKPAPTPAQLLGDDKAKAKRLPSASPAVWLVGDVVAKTGSLRLTDSTEGRGVRVLRGGAAGLVERVRAAGYSRCYRMHETDAPVLVVTTRAGKLVVTKAGRALGCT